jgi:hypothetical protein
MAVASDSFAVKRSERLERDRATLLKPAKVDGIAVLVPGF